MKPQSTMREWLHLHRLEAAACRDLLGRGMDGSPPAHSDRGGTTGLDGPAAWRLVVEALARAAPALAPGIAEAAASVRTVLGADAARYPRALTLRDAGRGVPLVVAPVRGDVSDLLVFAHEFGHALNYLLAREADPPPILRETCAILCETLAAGALPPELRGPAAALAERRRARHLGPLRAALLDVLPQPDAPYDYDWNYPPARVLADAAAERPDDLPRLFAARIPVAELAARARSGEPDGSGPSGSAAGPETRG